MPAWRRILRGFLCVVLICISGAVVAVVLYLLVLRPWQLRCGATDEEVERAMPGDELVPNADLDATRGVTVGAAPVTAAPVSTATTASTTPASPAPSGSCPNTRI
jgi:hypothetical protein